MKVYVIRADKTRHYKGYICDLPHLPKDYREIGEIVEGDIESRRITNRIVIHVNANGKGLLLPINRCIYYPETNTCTEFFVGNIVACRYDSDNVMEDIKESDIERIEKKLAPCEAARVISVDEGYEVDLTPREFLYDYIEK